MTEGRNGLILLEAKDLSLDKLRDFYSAQAINYYYNFPPDGINIVLI